MAKKKTQETRRAPRPLKLTAVRLETAELVTLSAPVDPDCGLGGAFVRVQPAEGADGEAIKQSAVLAGARAVRVIPSPKTKTVTEAAHQKIERVSIRQACTQLVDAATTRDRDALRREVERVLSKVGS